MVGCNGSMLKNRQSSAQISGRQVANLAAMVSLDDVKFNRG